MKILIICSAKSGKISPFVQEQVKSLESAGITFEFLKVNGKGIMGYLRELQPLRLKLKYGNYDLIHAHYGYCGLLANLQKMVPVITTYHGSDIHYRFNRALSYIASRLSAFNILTNNKQIVQLHLKKNFKVIPCGIDTNLFYPMDKSSCRRKMELNVDDKIVLFSSSFDRRVKNAGLAKQAVGILKDLNLIELKGYSRREVALIINAADVVLITSFYETGPLIVKEAMACNTPVVSTDVGDVKEIIKHIKDCYIVGYDSQKIAQKINSVLQNNHKTNGRDSVQKFDIRTIAKEIEKVYEGVSKVGRNP